VRGRMRPSSGWWWIARRSSTASGSTRFAWARRSLATNALPLFGLTFGATSPGAEPAADRVCERRLVLEVRGPERVPGPVLTTQLQRQQRIGAHVCQGRGTDHEGVRRFCRPRRSSQPRSTKRAGRATLAPAWPRLRERTAALASAELSADGRPDHQVHCASAVAQASDGAAARGRLSGRAQTPSRNSTVRSRLAASRNADRSDAVRAPVSTTPSSHSPAQGASWGSRLQSCAVDGDGGVRPARRCRRPRSVRPARPSG